MATENQTEKPANPEVLAVQQGTDQRPSGIVPFPIADVEELRRAVDAFVKIRNELLDADDVVEIGGKGEIVRSGLDRLALAYHVSYDVQFVEAVEVHGKHAFRAKATATLPSGTRHSTGWAHCTLDEVYAKAASKCDKCGQTALIFSGMRAGICYFRCEKCSQTTKRRAEMRVQHFAAATAESRAIGRAMDGLVGSRDLTQKELQAIKNRK